MKIQWKKDRTSTDGRWFIEAFCEGTTRPQSWGLYDYKDGRTKRKSCGTSDTLRQAKRNAQQIVDLEARAQEQARERAVVDAWVTQYRVEEAPQS